MAELSADPFVRPTPNASIDSLSFHFIRPHQMN